MAKKSKGIELDIGGNTSGLTAALGDVDKQLKSTGQELKEVERLLKIDPSNVELLAQKEKILGEQFELNTKKIEVLKKAKKETDKEIQKGTEVDEKQYRKLNREIAATESSMNRYSKHLKEVAKTSEKAADGIEDIAEAADDAAESTDRMGGGFTIAKGAIAGFIVDGVKSFISNMKQAIEESAEFRRETALLNAASERNGYTAEQAAEGFEYLYSVLGDQTQARTALNNAQALKLSQSELMSLLHSAVGAWGAYGDSIPIDGLMESVNETAKVGKITGVLADALNWANINEDKFNAKLEKCSSEQKRQQLIVDALNGQYSTLAANYEKNNGALIEQNKRTLEQQKALARLGDTFAGVKNKAEALKAQVYNGLADAAEKLKYGLFNVNEETMHSSKVTMDNAAAVKSLTDSYAEAEQARADTVNAQMIESEGARTLADELLKLADENGNVEEANRSRAQYILGELNNALGTEYKMVDGNIKQYGKLKDNIYEVINAKKLAVLMEAQEESYREAVEKQADAQLATNNAYTDYIQKLAQVKEAREKINALNEKMSETAEKYGGTSPAVNGVKHEIEQAEIGLRTLERGCDKLKETYDSAAEQYAKYASDIETYEEAMKIASKDGTDAAINFLEQRNQAYINADSASAGYADKVKVNIGKLGSEYQSALLELNSALDLYLKTGSESAGKAVGKALEKIQAKKTDYLAAGGEIKDGIILGMDGGGKPIEVNLENLSRGIKTQLKTFEKEGAKQGRNLVLGVAEGINADADDNKAYEAMRRFSKKVLSILPKRSDQHSPSKVTKKQGENLILGVAIGISETEIEAVTAVNGVYDSIARVSENSQLSQEKMREKAQKRELSNLKNALDLELITETDYYTKLKEYRDKYCEQGSDDWYNYTLQIIKYNKKVADALESENANTLKNLKTNMSSKLSGYSEQKSLIDTEYELWGYENAKSSAYDKNEKNIETLTKKVENQEAAVKAANDALWEAKQVTGENSEESREFQIQLNKEKIELEKLNSELKEAVRLKHQLYTKSLSGSIEQNTLRAQNSISGASPIQKRAPLKEGQKMGQETTINITQTYHGYKGTVSENNAALKKTLKNAEVALA